MELFELGFWLKNVELTAVFRSLAFWLLKDRGRAASPNRLAPPAQIRTCAANASGSSIESKREALIRVGM